MKQAFYNAHFMGKQAHYRTLHFDNLMLTYENEQVGSTQPYANKDQNAEL
jgi:hypothetical protein